MRKQTVLHILAAITQLVAGHALAINNLVTVSTTESWNGTLNPHSADGVTLAQGSGTEADPAVYTIPKGMTITASGKISTDVSSNKSIKFVVQNGDLNMDAGGTIDISWASRGISSATDRSVFIVDLSGTNSITGTGIFTSGIANGQAAINRCHRCLMITNVNYVAVSNISLIVNNAATTYPQFQRSAFITASNAVTVAGLIENKDNDTGGNGAADVSITGGSISVKGIDTRGMRTAGTINGNVVLKAVMAPGYDTNSVANKMGNKLTAAGAIRTDGTGAGTQGNVTMQSVVMQLDSGFSLATRSGATTTMNVGKVANGATSGQLFINNSGNSYSPGYNVNWTSDAVPSAGTLALSAAAYTVAEDGTTATITVKRTDGSTGAASVKFATSDGTALAGSDYTATNGTLNWADGDASDKTFAVQIANDTASEANETIAVTLSDATTAALGMQSSATLTITDNDGTVSFSATSYTATENSATALMTVKRVGGNAAGTFSVKFATSDGTALAGSDYTATNGTLSWADGDAANKTIAVALVDDSVVEQSETVNITLSNVSGAVTLGSPSSAVLTIFDDDGSPVSLSDVGTVDTLSFNEAWSVAGILDSRPIRGTLIKIK